LADLGQLVLTAGKRRNLLAGLPAGVGNRGSDLESIERTSSILTLTVRLLSEWHLPPA